MDFPTLLKILLILVVITCFGLIIWASSSNKKTHKSIHIDDYQVRLSLFMVICIGLWSFKLEGTISAKTVSNENFGFSIASFSVLKQKPVQFYQLNISY